MRSAAAARPSSRRFRPRPALYHHPRRHRSLLVDHARLDWIEERAAKRLCGLHQQWTVDYEPIAAIRKANPSGRSGQVSLDADARRQPREEQAARDQDSPHLLDNPAELTGIGD